MSTLLQMGITTRDPQSDQIGSQDQGIRDLYSAIMYRALHDLERFRVLNPPDEDIRAAIAAYRWFMGEDNGEEVSFDLCCTALGLTPIQVRKGIENQGLFLTDLELIPPLRVGRGRRKHQLSLVTPLDRKGGSH